MKKFLPIIIFLFSIRAFACTCSVPTITEKFIESDFVAKVRIVKNYKNVGSEERYKADIIISELYKGDRIKSIYVDGRSDDKIGGSCSIFIPENTELIVYAEKMKNGTYAVGMCSGLLYLDKQNVKKQKKELEILRIFKSKNINRTDNISYNGSSTLNEDLKQFDGIELDKSYGIYEIIFSSDLSVKSVSKISGFETPIDEKLIEIIKKTKWTSFDRGIENKVPENSKLLFGIYYYPKQGKHLSFLSQHYL